MQVSEANKIHNEFLASRSLNDVYEGVNRWGAFVKYCKERGATMMEDIDESYFYQEVAEIGPETWDKLYQIYLDYKAGMLPKKNYNKVRSIFVGIDSQYEQLIPKQNLNLDLKVFELLGIKLPLLKRLAKHGVKKVEDLKYVTGLPEINNVMQQIRVTAHRPLNEIFAAIVAKAKEDRLYGMVISRIEGESFRLIGEKFELTGTRIRQIINLFAWKCMDLISLILFQLYVDNGYKHVSEEKLRAYLADEELYDIFKLLHSISNKPNL